MESVVSVASIRSPASKTPLLFTSSIKRTVTLAMPVSVPSKTPFALLSVKILSPMVAVGGTQPAASKTAPAKGVVPSVVMSTDAPIGSTCHRVVLLNRSAQAVSLTIDAIALLGIACGHGDGAQQRAGCGVVPRQSGARDTLDGVVRGVVAQITPVVAS